MVPWRKQVLRHGERPRRCRKQDGPQRLRLLAREDLPAVCGGRRAKALQGAGPRAARGEEHNWALAILRLPDAVLDLRGGYAEVTPRQESRHLRMRRLGRVQQPDCGVGPGHAEQRHGGLSEGQDRRQVPHRAQHPGFPPLLVAADKGRQGLEARLDREDGPRCSVLPRPPQGDVGQRVPPEGLAKRGGVAEQLPAGPARADRGLHHGGPRYLPGPSCRLR
mmetsp:Transcript_50855/g.141075  ORF Transcript_50855/g.141075 Transcript_50855/m.141075 type:complete len:221 (+) Transcript_50855:286-948(+)